MLRNIGRKAGKENNESFKLLLLITLSIFLSRKKDFFKFAMVQRESQKFILIIEKKRFGYVIFINEK